MLIQFFFICYFFSMKMDLPFLICKLTKDYLSRHPALFVKDFHFYKITLCGPCRCKYGICRPFTKTGSQGQLMQFCNIGTIYFMSFIIFFISSSKRKISCKLSQATQYKIM